MDRRGHWNGVYAARESCHLSWFEESPTVSLRLMTSAGLDAGTCVVDIGGGDSRLVDHLLARGVRCLTVMDMSAAALARARERLGPPGATVTWVEADVTGDWSVPPVDIWHDRAVFHFLVSPADRARYIAHLHDTVKPGGSAIIATFALDGPERCSGLPVARYSADTLTAELGEGFQLMESAAHLHHTPNGTAQAFQYSRLLRTP